MSHNFFTGNLPLSESNHKKITILHLNNNRFGGIISTHIGSFDALTEINLSSNQLIGTIPSQIGNLVNVSTFSLSYNLLEGTIVSEFSNLMNLELLHLHHNMFTGSTDILNHSIRDFIADCGRTETSKPLVICPQCTTCCNTEDSCISTEKIWSHESMKYVKMNPTYSIVIFTVCAMIILMFSSIVLKSCRLFLPLPSEVRKVRQDGSANRFFLSNNKYLQFIAFLSNLFQALVIILFLSAGDITKNSNMWVYSISCSPDELECEDKSLVDKAGWFTFGGIIAVFLLPDMIDGVHLFYESSVNFNLRGIIASSVLLVVTILTVEASCIFIYAQSISNIAIIIDAVIVLFLNQVDEQVYLIINRLFPARIDQMEMDIFNYYLHENGEEASNSSNQNQSTDIEEPPIQSNPNGSKSDGLCYQEQYECEKKEFKRMVETEREENKRIREMERVEYAKLLEAEKLEYNRVRDIERVEHRKMLNAVKYECKRMLEDEIEEKKRLYEIEKVEFIKLLEAEKLEHKRILEAEKAEHKQMLNAVKADCKLALKAVRAVCRRILQDDREENKRVLLSQIAELKLLHAGEI